MKYLWLLGIFAFSSAQGSWLVKKIVGHDVDSIISVKKINTEHETRTIFRFPRFIPEGAPASKEIYEEVLVSEAELSAKERLMYKMISKNSLQKESIPGAVVKTLVQNGPSANRIDLTILGDGYTAQEQDKFFADAERIKNDLFSQDTFASYLPLFNFHAVFVPSKESGISDLKKIDTAFGLYRTPAGSKRAIYPGNTSAIDAAIALAPDTDYPILMANDDYYGGLGGQYAITTRSVESGQVVLRHELGHNFGQVGEEYDGGYVYSGANSSDDTNVMWKHWLTTDKVYEAKFLTGSYDWQNLAGKDHVSQFTFPEAVNGQPYSLDVKISSVGWSGPEQVSAYLDGNSLPYYGTYTRDRSFFDLGNLTSVEPGNHELRFHENTADGDNVLAFAQVLALAPGYDKGRSTLAAYATFDDFGYKTYRPTHDNCLMRNMLVRHFCAVDQENMWKKFLDRIRLVDNIEVVRDQIQMAIPETTFSVNVQTAPLPGLSANWYSMEGRGQSHEITELKNKFSAKDLPAGKYRIDIRFATNEVRAPSARFLDSRLVELK